jgi:DNA mismatch repair ATPase MutS
MIQDPIFNFYNKRIAVLETELKKVHRVSNLIYLTRLMTFILFVAFSVLFFQYEYNKFCLVFSFASLASFLFAVKIDIKNHLKETFLSDKLLVNQNELKFLNHQYEMFETGEEYTNLNPHLADDFDLFGKGSLYQYLNRCSLTTGKTKFAGELCKPERDIRIITEKQEAIKELTLKNEFIHDFQSFGMAVKESGDELTNLQSWLNQPAERNDLLFQLCIIMPVLTFSWIAAIILGFFSISSALIPLIINFIIIQSNNKKINQAHSGLTKTAATFINYTKLIRLIEEENFKSKRLSHLKENLFLQNVKASDSLSSLFKLLNYFDVRLNVMASLILNSLFLFDIQVYCQLSRWKKKNKDLVPQWFETLNEADATISFAVFAFNNQNHSSYPVISEGGFSFHAEELGHPLLNPETRVSNDVLLSGSPSVLIITGANMAGKSTFLRTLAVNLILAMNGSPVCARKLIFTPCDILSSIKIQDSLSNNESYFYAELLRLKDIINHVEKNPGTIVVLDEILRGTNTKDKQLGSLGLLEKLISLNSIVIIATHDLTIGELEKKYPGIVMNNCFEVELKDDQLIFDYKLKKGISQKLNASFLMKKMDIIN